MGKGGGESVAGVGALGDRNIVTGGSPAVESQAELNRICVITPRRACVRVLPAPTSPT